LKKCCVLDGTEDDMLQYGSEEDGNVKSEHEEVEEYGDSPTDW